MKRIISNFGKKPIEYAIRKITKGNKVVYHPVAKVQGYFSDWMPIIKVYPNRYFLLSIEVEDLTEQDCREHIEGHKQQVIKESKDSYFKVEYTKLVS